MSTDAITLLKADHKEVKALFTQFDRASGGAEKARGELVSKIIGLLTVHADIENEVMHHPTQPSALKETVDAVQK